MAVINPFAERITPSQYEELLRQQKQSIGDYYCGFTSSVEGVFQQNVQQPQPPPVSPTKPEPNPVLLLLTEAL